MDTPYELLNAILDSWIEWAETFNMDYPVYVAGVATPFFPIELNS